MILNIVKINRLNLFLFILKLNISFFSLFSLSLSLSLFFLSFLFIYFLKIFRMEKETSLQTLNRLLGTTLPEQYKQCTKTQISYKYCQCSPTCKNRVNTRINKFSEAQRIPLKAKVDLTFDIDNFIINLKKELNQEVVLYHNSLQQPSFFISIKCVLFSFSFSFLYLFFFL
jgi:hypothetical protein